MVVLTGIMTFVDPLEEREIFDMTLLARRDDADGDEKRPPALRGSMTPKPRSAPTLLPSPEYGQLLHQPPPARAEVPLREANEWHALIRVDDARPWRSKVRRKSEMRNR